MKEFCFGGENYRFSSIVSSKGDVLVTNFHQNCDEKTKEKIKIFLKQNNEKISKVKNFISIS